MKDMIKAEQGTSAKLKLDLAERNNRIIQLSHEYEDQINQTKELISLKDEELRKISSLLMVHDSDIIRLKVIN